MKRLIYLGLSIVLLSGCTILTSKSTLATPQETKEQAIVTGLTNQLNDKYSDSNITVTIYNDSALLTGQVSRLEDRVGAESLALADFHMAKVYNYLQVAVLETSAQKKQDVAITTTVKSQLAAIKEINLSSLRIITTNKVVYLLGQVTQTQAPTIINQIQSINGVIKVVPLFSYQEKS